METFGIFNLEQQGRAGTPGQILYAEAFKHDYRHVAGLCRDSDADGEEVANSPLFADAKVFVSARSGSKTEIVFTRKDMLVRLWWYITHAEVGWDVIGSNQVAVLEFDAALAALVPVVSHEELNVVPVKFWTLDANGQPESRTRKIEVNPWANIEDNYPSGVRSHLQELIDLREPQTGGKLVLWHGLPGTGKTHFLRSLAYAWRDWCDVSYVVDPDMMFERAYYLMNTVLSGEIEERWHLVVLEDSGEFMLNDAKNRTGQGLSRLLNLTDGLVGQGLRLLVLMTTNEKVFTLHPAVNRPGRCLAEIAFTPFSHKEAITWAADHGVSVHDTDEMSLADLYELVSETHIINELPRVSIGQYA